MPLFDSLFGAPSCFGCGESAVGPLCRRCRDRIHRPLCDDGIRGVGQVVAACDYEGAARNLLLAMKVRGRRDAADALVTLMVEAARRANLGAPTVTWVPGRRRDTTRRGFDHAEVLARGVAPGLAARPIGLLYRIADRPDQTSLSRSERAHSAAGAFAARTCRGRILLVDDLVTTGSTAGSCARALRRAGATRVDVLVACRVS